MLRLDIPKGRNCIILHKTERLLTNWYRQFYSIQLVMRLIDVSEFKIENEIFPSMNRVVENI